MELVFVYPVEPTSKEEFIQKNWSHQTAETSETFFSDNGNYGCRLVVNENNEICSVRIDPREFLGVFEEGLMVSETFENWGLKPTLPWSDDQPAFVPELKL